MTITKALSCSEAAAMLPELLDGELQAADATVLAHHVADCSSCAQSLEAERRAISDLRRKISEIRMPVEARERLWALLRTEADGQERPVTTELN
jgi:anti-sigma factor (TIGR02949 family)